MNSYDWRTLGRASAMAGALCALTYGVMLASDGMLTSASEKLGRLAMLAPLLGGIGALLANAQARVRGETRALAALDTPAARELLIATLDDADRDLRACAVYGLGELQAEEAVPGLMGRLADASPLVCRVAADSLARIGAPAAPALITALGEGETLTRIGAARALSIIQPKEAIPVLFAALDDPSATVTYYAEQALERMGVGLVLFRP